MAEKPTSATVSRLLAPEDWVKRQINTLKSVGQTNYDTGIGSPRADPIKAGIAAEPRFADSMKKAIEAKARAAGLGKTDMAAWFGYSSGIGSGRLVEGVTKRVAKVDAFVSKWVPQLKTHVDALDKLSTETLADRKAKVLANIDGLVELHGKA